jgi:Zn-dependent M28 family amino/carboxypeptidase
VYVGYGVTTEHYDDYSGIDAAGKIAVMLRGAPERFSSSERAYFSDGDVKADNAVKHGAVGTILVWPPDAERILPLPVLGRLLRRGEMDWLEPDSRPHHAKPELRGSAIVGGRGFAKLLQGSGRTPEEVFARASEGAPASFLLPGEIEIRITSRHESLESPNILARLPGSTLAGEHVVLTAHVDHEGLGEPKNGDAIYNGALDNASGTAAMLEVARAFASLPVRPRRSILFIGTAAEEEGLLGADYFANFPTVPLAGIVADVNLDGTASWYPPAEMIAFGAAHSTLAEDARVAAAMLDLRIIDDPHPEQAFFIRSDQYPFIKKGVPSIFFMIGGKSADPSLDGAALFERYLTTLYHTPQDDLSQGLDFDAGATLARLHFLTAYRIAQGERRPSWNPGDFFGERFGRK